MPIPILTKKRLVLTLGILGSLFLFFLVSLSSFLFFFQGKERVNLLFLGESGTGHQGGSLTDTIIFTSVSSSGTVLLSIPRDIWYEPKEGKINSLFARGGLSEAEQVLSEILGQKMDSSVLIDFNFFVKLVDFLGGIDVLVEGAFDDFKYPISGKEEDFCNGDKTFACRYEHIRFEAGWQKMNGETALKFVRSRHAEGDEGTDYARSRRQQKVISALKNKIFSWEFFLSPTKIISFGQLLREELKTDLKTDDLVSLVKILLSSSSRKTSTYVLDGWEKAEGYLYHPEKHSSGQWVLLPIGNNWGEVHRFVESIL